MDELVYPREKTLGAITLIIGVLVWVGVVVGTFGVVLIGLLLGFVLYLFAQSALIAHIRGNGVEVTEKQFPDLHAQLVDCSNRLKMKERPKAYVMNGNGALNAFATEFLGTEFLVLYSNVVDAMQKNVDGLRFYIGHELGHLRRKHLRAQFLRWPALWLPLLGAAYSRARESTCDRHGSACCDSPENALRALSVLSAGSTRWEQINSAEYVEQARASKGFWMSFHELISGYPWLTKRAARVMKADAGRTGRNPLAYLLAAFVPYAGRLGAGFSVVMLAYFGILAAIALPAYQDYVNLTAVAKTYTYAAPATTALAEYYETNGKIPESLESLGIASELPDGSHLSLDSEHMVLTIATSHGELILTPSADEAHKVTWTCMNGEGMRPNLLPHACR